MEEETKAVTETAYEEEEEELEEQLGSSLTLERVAAAKKYIESHYKTHMKQYKERMERELCHCLGRVVYSRHPYIQPYSMSSYLL